MGDCQSKPAKSTSPHHTPIREWTKILESLEKVILNINEDNIGESVSETMNLLSNNISPCPNLTLSRLIYSAYVSQRKDFNIYINFMKALDIKEKEINEKKFNKNNSDKVHAFANFLLHLCSQESNFLLGKMIEMKLISPYFIKSKKTFYFANYLNTEIINKLKKNQVPFSQYFFENYEELSKNDWEIHKKLIKKGVNPNEISKIIRNDEIEKLQEISSQEDFNFNQIIKPSLYERCSFINQENVSLIDFAAFFGSVKCFKYLLMNDVDIKNTGKYAIAGGNEEIIYLCEQNHSTFENALETSIKFHRNEIFHYFYENEIIDDSSTKITNLFLFTENPCMNVELFNFFLEQKRINFNSKSDLIFYLNFA